MKLRFGAPASLALVIIVALAILAPGVAAAGTTVLVDNLQPSWTAPGGGGVFSAYVASPSYGYASPGATAVYDGREAGVIKAGLTANESGVYDDEGLFGFIPGVTINAFAADTLTYDVQNQAGVNSVWMTIEIDTGAAGVRDDNTTYQHVPTSNPAGWHTVDAAAGLWQKWNNLDGDVTGNPLISLSDVAAANTGLDVVRAYLRLGMGNSYNNSGTGTIGWVDKATLAGLTYDFVVPTYWYVAPTGSDANEGTLASPFLTVQQAINAASAGDTINVAAGTYAEAVSVNKSNLTLSGANTGVSVGAVPETRGAESLIAGTVVLAGGVNGFTLDGFALKAAADTRAY